MQLDPATTLAIILSVIGLIFLIFFLINEAYDRAARNSRPRRRSQRWQDSPVPRSSQPRQHDSDLRHGWVGSVIGFFLLSALSTSFSHANRPALPPASEDYIAMPPPQSVGVTTSNLVQISVTNSSPQQMKVFFKGIEQQSAIIPECPECQIYTVPPNNCPANGVTQTYTLKPGDYEVNVTFSGPTTRPYKGHWTLLARNLYKDCFTLTHGVTQQGDRRDW